MDHLSQEELQRFANTLCVPESQLSTMSPLAIRLLTCDAEIIHNFPNYITALTKEQILNLFPSKER
jgi:hypothetical protein